MDELLCAVALSMVKGVGPARYRLLVERFGGAAGVFVADFEDLKSVVSENVAKNIRGFDFSVAKKVIDRSNELGFEIVTLQSNLYPERLKYFNYSPPVFWLKGNLGVLEGNTVGVVGTRRTDSSRTRAKKKSVEALSEENITIISGGAYGIDTVAHKTTLDNGGETVAVLGSGLDVPYPWQNRALFEKISESGALISEFPPGTKPNAENFPKRNRIISALSDALVIIEAGETSGALLTARWALEQGKEIFALPGPFDSEKSRGTNRLIKEGARIITNVNDILEEFGLTRSERKEIQLTSKEQEIFQLLEGDPVHIDQLVLKTSMDVTEILSILLGLELKGLIRQIPGKYFVREV